MSMPAAFGCRTSRFISCSSVLDFSMLTLLVVLTSASPVATGLEISSTGSLPPHERSHRNRSHALHRAQRRYPRHGFSCGPTFFQLRSPAAAAQVSALSDVPLGSSDALQ